MGSSPPRQGVARAPRRPMQTSLSRPADPSPKTKCHTLSSRRTAPLGQWHPFVMIRRTCGAPLVHGTQALLVNDTRHLSAMARRRLSSMTQGTSRQWHAGSSHRWHAGTSRQWRGWRRQFGAEGGGDSLGRRSRRRASLSVQAVDQAVDQLVQAVDSLGRRSRRGASLSVQAVARLFGGQGARAGECAV